MEISAYREAIDAIDEQLLKLLNERASMALKIGESKFKNRIMVINSDREKAIFEKLNAQNSGPLQEQHIYEIFSAIIAASKNLQHLYQSYEDV
jgi:chorismate mutase